MNRLVSVSIVIALIVGVFYYWRWTAIKQQVRQRLVESDEPIVDSIFAERAIRATLPLDSLVGRFGVRVFSFHCV